MSAHVHNFSEDVDVSIGVDWRPGTNPEVVADALSAAVIATCQQLAQQIGNRARPRLGPRQAAGTGLHAVPSS